MKRKKWTAQTEVTDALLKLREKRKWQISLRRYVLEQNKSSFYAPYFGLDIPHFRKWIEIQFTGEMNWENFSQAWQFEHVVPLAYFNFEQEAELRLCWHFTNIRVDKVDPDHKSGRANILAAKAYFQALHERTQYPVCAEMVQKIACIEADELAQIGPLESFIQNNKEYIQTLAGLSSQEYDNLNKGVDIKNILAERALMARFG